MRFDRILSPFVLSSAFALALSVTPHAALAAPPFARGPIIQSLGTTGVTVKVEMATPEIVTVEVTGPDNVAKKTSVTDARKFQSIRIDGLTPSTAYSYRVLAGEAATASETGHFTTAPTDARAFKFVLYGDSRSDPASHAAVVRQILATPSDFLVHTGDMVAMGDEEDDWKGLFDIENSLLRDRCVFASIGNHELAGDKGVGAATFLRYFASADEGGKERPQLYGSVRWGNTRFFLLNAMDDWSGEEKAWLKEELDRALNEQGLVHRFAVLHHGPHSSGPHGGNDRLLDNGVMPIFTAGKVDLVLAGHDHAYERGAGEGLKYIVSGGAGAPLYPRKHNDPATKVYESAHHFVEVSVDGDKVGIVAKRASGSIIEKCGFAGDGAWDCDAKSDKPKGTGPSAEDLQRGSACGCATPGGSTDGQWIVSFAVVAGFIALRARSKGALRRGVRRA